MIRPLRRAHWWWMVFLVITLPVLLVLFLAARDFSGREFSAPLQISGSEPAEKSSAVPSVEPEAP